MSNVFFTADLHLGHEKTCTVFEGHDGRPLRPFANADEMDEELIKRWNARVGARDTTYVLGDVCIDIGNLWKMDRFNGRKILVPGNHDKAPARRYLEHFDDIVAYKVFKTKGRYDRFVATHVPIHPEMLKRWGANVHGHLHSNIVMRPQGTRREVMNENYLCVSVEQTDYAPLSLDEVIARLEDGPKALNSAFLDMP